MKKILLSVLVVTTIIVQLTFPSSAKDCPTISETIKVVTVKNSAVTLRTEPKYSNNNQGPAINEGEKLTVILPKPELGPDLSGAENSKTLRGKNRNTREFNTCLQKIAFTNGSKSFGRTIGRQGLNRRKRKM